MTRRANGLFSLGPQIRIGLCQDSHIQCAAHSLSSPATALQDPREPLCAVICHRSALASCIARMRLGAALALAQSASRNRRRCATRASPQNPLASIRVTSGFANLPRTRQVRTGQLVHLRLHPPAGIDSLNSIANLRVLTPVFPRAVLHALSRPIAPPLSAGSGSASDWTTANGFIQSCGCLCPR